MLFRSRYLCDIGVLEAPDEELFLPSNLFIAATMNTSDQSLYPMDSAFKRRWNWISVPIDYEADKLVGVVVAPTKDAKPVPWLTLVERINFAVVQAGLSGDKRIGPWYIKAFGGTIPAEQVRNKLLFYLWHDVFREQAHLCFATPALTFDDAQSLFDVSGVEAALSPLFPAKPEASKPTIEASSGTSPTDT